MIFDSKLVHFLKLDSSKCIDDEMGWAGLDLMLGAENQLHPKIYKENLAVGNCIPPFSKMYSKQSLAKSISHFSGFFGGNRGRDTWQDDRIALLETTGLEDDRCSRMKTHYGGWFEKRVWPFRSQNKFRNL
ncbi:hypothetical protein K7432_014447 [Basidiobolus ranarum]|uniref:Uncharacterized protein n=1 Tax=Basidiobolus ranarum TaxID=34480 RepID=A0ABR2WHJ4_9FUNG